MVAQFKGDRGEKVSAAPQTVTWWQCDGGRLHLPPGGLQGDAGDPGEHGAKGQKGEGGAAGAAGARVSCCHFQTLP